MPDECLDKGVRFWSATLTDLTPTTQRWIGRPAPRAGARLRLICLPYAGGGTAAFRPWTKHLPPDIELCLVQLPGREKRMGETPYTVLENLVSDLTEALDPLLDRQYALFGHSMGALTAFALTRHLRSRGHPQPAHLFVSGRRAPQIPENEAPLHHLPDAAFVAALVRRYNGIPPAVLQDVELLRLFIPSLRADLTMIETYRYVEAPPLDCPITAFGGWEDGRATQVDLASWRDLTRGDFTLRMFPGGHFFIQSSRMPLVEMVAGELADPAVRPRPRTTDQNLGTANAVAPANPRIIG